MPLILTHGYGRNAQTAGTVAAWATAGDIINDAAVLCHLTEVEDPYASTDPNFILLCRCLKMLGRELWPLRNWTQLQREYTYTTETGTNTLPLPDDFGRLLDDTHWNRSDTQRLFGPTSPQHWQYMVSSGMGATVTIGYRIRQSQIELYPTTGIEDGLEMAFEYGSRWWVQTSASDTPDTDVPTASSDTIWFDALLCTYGLRLKFLESMGFDASAALADYQRALAAALENDAPSPALSLAGPDLEDAPPSYQTVTVAIE